MTTKYQFTLGQETLDALLAILVDQSNNQVTSYAIEDLDPTDTSKVKFDIRYTKTTEDGDQPRQITLIATIL